MVGVYHRRHQHPFLILFIVDRYSIQMIRLKYLYLGHQLQISHLLFFSFTKIWCAVGIDLNGLTPETDQTSLDQLSKQLIESYHQMIDEPYLKLSSILWIAAKSNDTAMITILDSNKPEQIIDKFPLGNAIIYSMGSIPGERRGRCAMD